MHHQCVTSSFRYFVFIAHPVSHFADIMFVSIEKVVYNIITFKSKMHLTKQQFVSPKGDGSSGVLKNSHRKSKTKHFKRQLIMPNENDRVMIQRMKQKNYQTSTIDCNGLWYCTFMLLLLREILCAVLLLF